MTDPAIEPPTEAVQPLFRSPDDRTSDRAAGGGRPAVVSVT